MQSVLTFGDIVPNLRVWGNQQVHRCLLIIREGLLVFVFQRFAKAKMMSDIIFPT